LRTLCACCQFHPIHLGCYLLTKEASSTRSFWPILLKAVIVVGGGRHFLSRVHQKHSRMEKDSKRSHSLFQIQRKLFGSWLKRTNCHSIQYMRLLPPSFKRIRLDRGSEASRDLNRLLDSPDGGESSLENIFLSFTSSEAVLCVARPKMKWWSLPLWSHGFESVDLCPFSLFFVHAQPSALPLHSIRYVVSAYIIKVDPLLKLVPMPRQRRAWNECAF